MNKILLVTVKNVYGTDLIYPADETAKILAALTGKKTLSAAALKLAKELGYEIVVKQTVLEFK